MNKVFTYCILLSTTLAGVLAADSIDKIYLDDKQIAVDNNKYFIIGQHCLFTTPKLNSDTGGVFVYISDIKRVGECAPMACYCNKCLAADVVCWRYDLRTKEPGNDDATPGEETRSDDNVCE